jgi:hypothetical protein
MAMGHFGAGVCLEGSFVEILHDVFRERIGMKACGNVKFSCEKFRVELVEALIHSDFCKSGLKMSGFQRSEYGFGMESLGNEMELFAFVDEIDVRFDFADVLKVFPNTIVHPASGK